MDFRGRTRGTSLPRPCAGIGNIDILRVTLIGFSAGDFGQVKPSAVDLLEPRLVGFGLQLA